MKKVFNIKNILIFFAIAVLLFVTVYFFFIKEKKLNERIMNCSAELSKTSNSNITFDVKVNYTNKIEKMLATMNVEILGDLSDQELEKMESAFKSYYDSSIKGNSIKTNVYRENNIIKIEYDIDYNKYKPGDIELFSFVTPEDVDKEPTIEDLKKNIEKIGGGCIEE